jgi:toxin FitB
MIILDTNVVSEFGKPAPDENVKAWLGRQTKTDLFLCAPGVMEQAYGAQKALLRSGTDRYFRVLDDLTSLEFNNRVVAFDGSAPRIAGIILATRESAGRPMSLGDAMIAAIAIAHGATLATRNTRDFDGLDLKLANPFEAGA